MMGTHPRKTAPFASMRAHTAKTVALLWTGKWDVAKAAGLYAVFMAFFVGVIAVDVALQPADDGGEGWLETFATVYLFTAFVIPPLVLLHALGSRIRGRAAPFRESIKQTAVRAPRLLLLGVYAAVFGLCWLMVLYMAAGFLLVIPTILPVIIGGRVVPDEMTMTPILMYAWGVVSGAGLLAAGVILARTALLAPFYILVDGAGVTNAWKSSHRAMSWRALVSMLPCLAPCMAYVFAPLYFLFMSVLPPAAWVYGFMALIYVLPPVCLALALTAPLMLWQGESPAPVDPTPNAPQPAPASV